MTTDILIGLQWAGVAFGIFLVMAFGSAIVIRFLAWMFIHRTIEDIGGAPEGDLRSFLRDIDDHPLMNFRLLLLTTRKLVSSLGKLPETSTLSVRWLAL